MLGVVPGELDESVGIAQHECLGELDVLLLRFPQIAGEPGFGAYVAFDQGSRMLQRAQVMRAVRRTQHGFVEARIQVEPLRPAFVVGVLGKAAHLRGDRIDRGDVGLRALHDGAPGEFGLQQPAQVEDLVDLLRVQGCHGIAAARMENDDSVRLQAGQRFAQRAAADAEPVGHLVLPQHLAGTEHAVQDGIAHLLVDHARQSLIGSLGGKLVDRHGAGPGNTLVFKILYKINSWNPSVVLKSCTGGF
ncbi:hypothetical protein D9M72_258170 [compost metagenome]